MSLQGACGGLTIVACDDVAILDEGVFQGEAAAINFVGDITATVSEGVATISVSAGGGGAGSVTSVSVVTANGFRGVVSNPSTTPAITIDASAIPVSKISGGSFGRAFFGVETSASAQSALGTWTNLTVTNSAIRVLDADQSNFLQIVFAHSLATNRTLTINTGSTDKSVTLGGNLNLVGGLTVSANTVISTYGAQIVSAPTTAAAQQALGAGTFGAAFFATSTTAQAQSMLEGGAVGLQVFRATTTAALQEAIDASAKQNIIQYQDEGVNLGAAGGIVTVNFTGGAVTASATGSTLTVRCSAGGGG